MKKPTKQSLLLVLIILVTYTCGWFSHAALSQTDANPVACFEVTQGVPYPLHPIPCP